MRNVILIDRIFDKQNINNFQKSFHFFSILKLLYL